MTHADIDAISDLKGHKILIASAFNIAFWLWLKQRFGFTDDMAGRPCNCRFKIGPYQKRSRDFCGKSSGSTVQ
jgi:hypothetical protein